MISLILLLLAAWCKAAIDKIADHHGNSVFANLSPWWNKSESWRYKWRNGEKSQGERFLGSSTVFVWVTDAWHFIQAIGLTLIVAAVVLYEPLYPWWWLDLIVFKLGFTVMFEITFRWILEE